MELSHIIVMTTAPGYWGKGKTVEEAIKAAKWIAGGDRVRVIKVDEKAFVNEMGELEYTAREHLGVGKVAASRKQVLGLKPE